MASHRMTILVVLASVLAAVAAPAGLRGQGQALPLSNSTNKALAGGDDLKAMATWGCGCKWPYDVCSYTTCYRRSSCGALDAAGSAETPEAEAAEELNAAKFNASLQASVAAAGGSEGVFHWKCNCRFPYSYCSYTTCFRSCR